MSGEYGKAPCPIPDSRPQDYGIATASAQFLVAVSPVSSVTSALKQRVVLVVPYAWQNNHAAFGVCIHFRMLDKVADDTRARDMTQLA